MARINLIEPLVEEALINNKACRGDNFILYLEVLKKYIDTNLSLRDVFHILQLGVEIDRLAEEGKLRSPIQEIIRYDLGVFGVDEILGLDLAHLYGVIGATNFGDIDVNKPSVVAKLNDDGKDLNGMCHTFLDDIVGAIAAAASTRVAQIISENKTEKNN